MFFLLWKIFVLLWMMQNLESKDVQNAIIPLEDKEKSTFQNAHIEEMNLESSFGQETRDETAHLRLKLLKKEMEIEKLMIERDQLLEERDAIQATNLTLAEEALYAKDLASAATMESMRLHQEVKELCVQNSKLAEELANAQNISYAHVGLSPDSKEYLRQSCSIRESGMYVLATEASEERTSDDVEGRVMREKQEVAVESLLAGKESDQLDLWHRLDKARKKEFNLENELTELWALVSSFKESPTLNDPIKVNFECIPTPPEVPQVVEPMGCECEYGCTIVSSDLSKEGHHPTGLQTIITQVECEDLEELDLASLDDLCSLHREALDRLCQAKAKVRERLERRQTGCHFVEAAYNLQINGRPS
ncbi:hypothetical protein KP509_1Z317900 [Ceratopteris richardii]|nr:hypothetical protein KP509_1Z317900 [Ceratopteris richardii]